MAAGRSWTPDTEAHVVPRDFGAPAHETSSGSPRGSTTVSDVDGIPTCTPAPWAYTTS